MVAEQAVVPTFQLIAMTGLGFEQAQQRRRNVHAAHYNLRVQPEGIAARAAGPDPVTSARSRLYSRLVAQVQDAV